MDDQITNNHLTLYLVQAITFRSYKRLKIWTDE
jgi:hypothetical protein